MKKWFLLGAAIVLEVTATLCLKGALNTSGLYLVVIAGYVGAFWALFIALRNGMALGVGYGIWAASGVALTAIMSLVIYGEPITLLMGMGILFIIAGVLLVELGAQAAQKKEGLA